MPLIWQVSRQVRETIPLRDEADAGYLGPPRGPPHGPRALGAQGFNALSGQHLWRDGHDFHEVKCERRIEDREGLDRCCTPGPSTLGVFLETIQRPGGAFAFPPVAIPTSPMSLPAARMVTFHGGLVLCLAFWSLALTSLKNRVDDGVIDPRHAIITPSHGRALAMMRRSNMQPPKFLGQPLLAPPPRALLRAYSNAKVRDVVTGISWKDPVTLKNIPSWIGRVSKRQRRRRPPSDELAALRHAVAHRTPCQCGHVDLSNAPPLPTTSWGDCADDGGIVTDAVRVNYNFAVMSDAGRGWRDRPRSDADISGSPMAATIRSLDPLDLDFVAVLGDLTNQAANGYTQRHQRKRAWQLSAGHRVFRFLDRKTPLFVAAGEMEVGGTPTHSTVSDFETTFGPAYFSHVIHEVCHVFLNTSLVFDPTGAQDLYDAQNEWIKRTLNKCSSLGHPIIAFGHHPILPRKPSADEDRPLTVMQARSEDQVARRTALHKLLEEHEVKFVFSGHWNVDAHRAHATASGGLIHEFVTPNGGSRLVSVKVTMSTTGNVVRRSLEMRESFVEVLTASAAA